MAKKMNMKINEMRLEELFTLYNILSEICKEYSRITDGYTIISGDRTFEEMPEDVEEMIRERQQFYSYKNAVMGEMKNKIYNIFL